MWTITSLNLTGVAGAQAFMSDGLPVMNIARNTTGSSYRLMITPGGSIDITDLGAQPGGPQPNALAIGYGTYWYSGSASISLTLISGGFIGVAGNGNSFTTSQIPFPAVSANDIALIDQMVELKILPYQQLVGGARPYSVVAPLAKVLFPWTPYANQLGLTVYDWTTADFFRMDAFNWFRYTALTGQPLDGPDIVNAIWTSNWPPYTPQDTAFMNSMMMKPAASETDVAKQYAQVNQKLLPYLDALKRVTAAATAAMPRTSTISKPMLYSGQVDVSNLPIETFPVYFSQYPGNAGPAPSKMGMPLQTALTTFMAPNNLVNLKSFMSFTDSLSDAIHYSNGIVVAMSPQNTASQWTWLQCAYITALSDEADKTEYLFGPGSQFTMGSSSQQSYNGKNYTLINMSEWTL